MGKRLNTGIAAAALALGVGGAGYSALSSSTPDTKAKPAESQANAGDSFIRKNNLEALPPLNPDEVPEVQSSVGAQVNMAVEVSTLQGISRKIEEDLKKEIPNFKFIVRGKASIDNHLESFQYPNKCEYVYADQYHDDEFIIQNGSDERLAVVAEINEVRRTATIHVQLGVQGGRSTIKVKEASVDEIGKITAFLLGIHTKYLPQINKAFNPEVYRGLNEDQMLEISRKYVELTLQIADEIDEGLRNFQGEVITEIVGQ